MAVGGPSFGLWCAECDVRESKLVGVERLPRGRCGLSGGFVAWAGARSRVLVATRVVKVWVEIVFAFSLLFTLDFGVLNLTRLSSGSCCE